jgi:hypothetical protein
MSGGTDPLISDDGSRRQVSAQLQTMVTLPPVMDSLIPTVSGWVVPKAGMDFWVQNIISPACNQITIHLVASPYRANSADVCANIKHDGSDISPSLGFQSKYC